MDKVTFPFAIAAICLVFTVKILSIPLPLPPPHPLCLSQFALANQACSLLPIEPSFTTNSKPDIHTKSSTDSDQDDDDLGEEDEGEGEDGQGEDDGDDEHQHEHGHDNDHNNRHPGNSAGHGSSGHRSGGHGGGADHGNEGHRHEEGGQHGRRGRKSSRHSHHHISQETAECCKWLEEVDASCVCDLLIRLPNFLRRPPHSITVRVQNSCNVTYACQGRLFS